MSDIEADLRAAIQAVDATNRSRSNSYTWDNAVSTAIAFIEEHGSVLLAERERLVTALQAVSDHHNGEDGHDMNDSCWRNVYALASPAPTSEDRTDDAALILAPDFTDYDDD